MSALQSERDGLLCKLAGTTSGGSGASSNGRGDMSTGVSGKASHESKEGAAFAKMKARVAELEARIKENRCVDVAGEAGMHGLMYLMCCFALHCVALRLRRTLVPGLEKYHIAPKEVLNERS